MTLGPDQLDQLLVMLRRAHAADLSPDPQELSRMWLVTQTHGSGSVYLAELHAASRLMTTPAGLDYLTAEDRELVGVAFAIRELVIPSPVDLAQDFADRLEADASGERPLERSARWRIQRLAKQSRRAQADPRRWARFVLRNEVEFEPGLFFGVWMGTGQRVGARAPGDPEQPGIPVPASDPVWLHCDYTGFALAVEARTKSAAGSDPPPAGAGTAGEAAAEPPGGQPG